MPHLSAPFPHVQHEQCRGEEEFMNRHWWLNPLLEKTEMSCRIALLVCVMLLAAEIIAYYIS